METVSIDSWNGVLWHFTRFVVTLKREIMLYVLTNMRGVRQFKVIKGVDFLTILKLLKSNICLFVLYLHHLYLRGIALGYGLDDRGYDSRQGLGIFPFTTASRPSLGPTQPSIQRVPWAPSLGVRRSVREADHTPPSISEFKECVELYLHPKYNRTTETDRNENADLSFVSSRESSVV
jgi:hypothetical protein